MNGKSPMLRILGGTLVAWSWLTGTTAFAVPLEGEIIKITKGRTAVMVDLSGNATVETGATVKLTVDGKERTGTVKKVTDNGNAFLKLNKGLPKNANVGDKVTMDLTSGGSEGDTGKSGAALLKKGGANKAYWNEISFLAAHRKPGMRADVAVSYLGGEGSNKTTGGSAKSDVEFAVTDKHTNFSGGAGFVGRGGIGGGILFEYDSADFEESASIKTANDGSGAAATDKDTRTAESKVLGFMPYFEYLDRASSAGMGFGAGIGIPIRSVTAKTATKIGPNDGDAPEAKTNEIGVTLEGLVGNPSWAVIIGLTPSLGGKIKQSGQDDVDHKSSEYAFHFESYGRSLKFRAGLTLISSKDDYKGAALEESGTKFSGTVDVSLGKFDLIPFLDYTSSKRKIGDANGTFGELDVGSRFAMAGTYAPFVSLSLSRKSGEEKNDDGVKQESLVGGIRLAGGVNI